MSCTHLHWLKVVSAAVLMAALSGSAFADPPEPVVRTFGVFVGGATVPDFKSEDSVAVILLPDAVLETSPQTLMFVGTEDVWNPACIPDGLDERLDGTTWVEHAAHHTTIGPQEADRHIFWLHDDGTSDPPPPGAQPDPPPIGTHTFTGPDGLVIDQQVFEIIRCTSGCCKPVPTSNGAWRVAREAESGACFVVVTAWFFQ